MNKFDQQIIFARINSSVETDDSGSRRGDEKRGRQVYTGGQEYGGGDGTEEEIKKENM